MTWTTYLESTYDTRICCNVSYLTDEPSCQVIGSIRLLEEMTLLLEHVQDHTVPCGRKLSYNNYTTLHNT